MIGQGGGAIVNLASPAGFHAVPRVGPYSISKAGMVMLTKQTAREYAAEGIRANAVAPGVTRTPILDDLPAAHLDQIVAAIPQGRIARPDEIASMVARSEEHTSELQSLMRISYAVFCLKKKNNHYNQYDSAGLSSLRGITSFHSQPI